MQAAESDFAVTDRLTEELGVEYSIVMYSSRHKTATFPSRKVAFTFCLTEKWEWNGKAEQGTNGTTDYANRN